MNGMVELSNQKRKTTDGMGADSGLRRYQSMDLLIWTVLLFVFEAIVVKAGTVWFRSQPWTLSLVPALTAVVYMRWGVYGLFYSALGGVAICFASKAEVIQYVVYVFGNLFSCFSLLMLKKMGKEKVRSSVFFSLLYATVVFVLMALGRGVVSLVLGNGLYIVVDFITTDILSLVFAMVVVWIARRLDGVFEDQISYLMRLKAEEEKEKGRER